MTAEIAILNRHGVALAADSALTVQRQRVWKTGNKLFSLSPVNDIGIMIFGSGDLVGYSWELIAKTFRDYTGGKTFRTVSECADEFLEYLSSNQFSNFELEKLSIHSLIVDILEYLNENIEYSKKIEFRKKLSDKISEFGRFVDENHQNLDGSISESDFFDLFHGDIKILCEDVFKQVITKSLCKEITEFLYKCYSKSVETEFSTGVVLAGFGKNQLFPELVEIVVDGKIRTSVRAWRRRGRDLNDPSAPLATLFPFAQSDMFQLFMEGTTQKNKTFMRTAIQKILNEKSNYLVNSYVKNPTEKKVEKARQRKENQQIVRDFSRAFSSYVEDSMVKPVTKVVATLPKEEMAAMAEALVEITTLRRKVDSSVESVGGPTDVVVISKGDGLIWVKRKHYFDIEMNSDFRDRKKLRLEDSS